MRIGRYFSSTLNLQSGDRDSEANVEWAPDMDSYGHLPDHDDDDVFSSKETIDRFSEEAMAYVSQRPQERVSARPYSHVTAIDERPRASP